MTKHFAGSMLCLLVVTGFASAARAQAWSAEQQEVWAVEEEQWKLAAAEDLSWIDTMVHPSVSFWETEQPVPQNRASLLRWNRYTASSTTVLEQEIRPISIVVTGNVAVVNYVYQIAREDDQKKREMVRGRYMDILIKDKGKWLFLAWSGGDDPKK
jgi:ketosteroid isomerase-like protein